MQTITRDAVLAALTRHIGRCNGVTAQHLVREVRGDMDLPLFIEAAEERQLREVIVALRCEGHHIGAHPSSGYYICATPEELDEACLFLFDRAMTSLQQVSAMKKVSLPDLKGQLRLPT
jgi:hypothetical protein